MPDYKKKMVKRGRVSVLALTYKGVDYIVRDEAKRLGIDSGTVSVRISRGKPFAEVFAITDAEKGNRRLDGDFRQAYEGDSDLPYGLSPESLFLAGVSRVFGGVQANDQAMQQGKRL